MNSEKVKEIKKALETCMHTRVSSCRECPYNYTNTKTKHSECFRMAEHALTLINELENENEILKINMHETENLSFQINQMNGDLILENQTLKDRIAELEKKIENGTLIELPCKVGDTVYSNERIMFEPLTVKVIVIHQSIKFPVSCTLIAMAKDGRAIYFPSDNFNEDWFLTKAEAEAKLKELQEQNND